MIKKISLCFMLFLFSLSLWGAQDAMVTSDRAIIYADELMTSPIGFVSKGKKVRVGEIARNKGQVYPIIVSGKMAFIPVRDLNTEKESVDSDRLVMERFSNRTNKILKKQYSLNYLVSNTQLKVDEGNGISNNDSLTWSGLSLRGDVLIKKYWDLQVLFNFLSAQEDIEEFRMLEVGLGTAYRLIDKERFTLKAEAQLLLIPFASYEVEDAFRNNGYGVTVGGGLNFNYRFTKNWGAMASAGIYYTKLNGFDAPEGFESIAPALVGNRFGLGITYQF